MESLILKIVAGILIGVGCKFIGDAVEKILLDRRKLEVKRAGHENYFIVVVMAVFGGLIMWDIPLSAEIIYAYLLLIICEVIVVSDIHHRIIPNGLLIAMLVSKTVFGIPDLFGANGFPTFHVVDSIVGLLVGFIVFMIPAFLSKQVGAGDIKLAATAGFVLGVMGCLVTIVLMGILVIIYVILQKQMPILTIIKTMIPMGPFLAIAMMIVILLPMNFGGIPF